MEIAREEKIEFDVLYDRFNFFKEMKDHIKSFTKNNRINIWDAGRIIDLLIVFRTFRLVSEFDFCREPGFLFISKMYLYSLPKFTEKIW